jgi:hypothetical protein
MMNRAEKLAALTKDWTVKDGSAVRVIPVENAKQASKIVARLIVLAGRNGADLHINYNATTEVTLSMAQSGPTIDKGQRGFVTALGRLVDRSREPRAPKANDD